MSLSSDLKPERERGEGRERERESERGERDVFHTRRRIAFFIGVDVKREERKRISSFLLLFEEEFLLLLSLSSPPLPPPRSLFSSSLFLYLFLPPCLSTYVSKSLFETLLLSGSREISLSLFLD